MKYLLTNIARGLIFFTSAADPCKKIISLLPSTQH